MKTVGRIRIYLILALFFSVLNAFSQGTPGVPGHTCDSAGAFCSEFATLTFPASTGVASFQSGVGCLGSTPNPAWYKMQVSTPGRINIHMTTNPSHDLDFICWGPFPTEFGNCGSLNLSNVGSSHGPSYGANPSSLGGYPIGNIVDCSYTAQAEEYVHIPNAVPGQWYILLITNFSNQPCQISFGSDPTSTGSTNCAILTPPPVGDTVCMGQTATLSVSSPVTGASYIWEGPNDFWVQTNDASITIPNVTAANAGTYSLAITYNGRTGDALFCNLVVNSKPTMTVTTDTICVGEMASISASGASSYNWSTTQTTATIDVSPTVTTPYSVTGTTVWGCKDSAQTQVVVYNNPVITITPSVICSGDSAIAFAPNALSYSWDNGLGTDTIVKPIVDLQQHYMLTVVVPGGCRDSALLTVNPNPIVTCSATEICAGQTSIVSASGANTYNWSNFQTGATISVSPMSNMVLSVDATDLNGCKGSAQTTVVVHPTPVSSFQPNETLVTIEEGDITFIDNSTDATSWSYNFGEYNNDLNTSTEQSPTHKYLHTGYFQVWQVVSTDYGCKDSSYTRVQVEAPFFFYVPSAFTPDHDGKNEYFCPSGKGIDLTNYSLEIYDRWGAMIFHTNDLYECWDGTINGVRVPEGSYIYKIKLKDQEYKTHDYLGDFVILR